MVIARQSRHSKSLFDLAEMTSEPAALWERERIPELGLHAIPGKRARNLRFTVRYGRKVRASCSDYTPCGELWWTTRPLTLRLPLQHAQGFLMNRQGHCHHANRLALEATSCRSTWKICTLRISNRTRSEGTQRGSGNQDTRVLPQLLAAEDFTLQQHQDNDRR